VHDELAIFVAVIGLLLAMLHGMECVIWAAAYLLYWDGALSLTSRWRVLAQTAHYSRPIFGYRF
jgi:uncharacterized protein YhhL (DUF1145 family)